MAFCAPVLRFAGIRAIIRIVEIVENIMIKGGIYIDYTKL